MTNNIDPRILNLSYSSILTKHACPRKFQLYRLNAAAQEDSESDSSNITFAFGHVVGDGIQQVFKGCTEDEIFFTMFLGWHADLFAENSKQKKSFFRAMFAVQKLIAMRNADWLSDYELVYWEGKPAVELGFSITFPDGFKFRGSVDAVLRHISTGEVLVLEIKTSSATDLNPATFKNSAQAIGYSIVLDVLFPELSSYKVHYCVYLTKQSEYEQLQFTKSYFQRALWIQELLLDIEEIKRYEEIGVYPMRGESCFSYYRECEYLQTCTLNTAYLTKPYDASSDAEIKKLELEEEKFTIKLTLADLINSQLEKASKTEQSHQQVTHPTTVVTDTGDIIL